MKGIKQTMKDIDGTTFRIAIVTGFMSLIALIAPIWFYFSSSEKPDAEQRATHALSAFATNRLYAMSVTTNLVPIQCRCGYCDPKRGIRVPEHINQIGYDLAVQVSTSYFPVVMLPIEPTPSPTRNEHLK